MDPGIVVVFITAATAAVVSSLSYGIRSWHAWQLEKAERHVQMVLHLQTLAVRLRTARSIFLTQNLLRNRFHATLQSDQFGDRPVPAGYEALMTAAHSTFTDEQKELHALLRGMTQLALRPANLALTEWLASDTTFKTGAIPISNPVTTLETAAVPIEDPASFSSWLHQLELHLTLWHAKYEYWMADERHALVYLADEQDHGVPFPRGIEEVVDAALEELGQPNLNSIPVPR
ncbi:MAG TPA: hypothetical protein VD767_02085 [Thermomicrobiales bacterium]|nr:hypothetical protein [Thermomicrobiales bacterium]